MQKQGIGQLGFLLVISGPSGVGKTTIIREIKLQDKHFRDLILYTTRELRGIEPERVHIELPNLKRLESVSEVFHVVAHLGAHYGLPRAEVKKLRDHAPNVILDYPVSLVAQICSLLKVRPYVAYLMPPSVQELKRRLTDRNETQSMRLERGLEELARTLSGEFHGIVNSYVINDTNQMSQTARAILFKYDLWKRSHKSRI